MFLSRDQVKESILLELGWPNIDVDLKLVPDQISPMTHLDKAINETLDLMFRWNTNESTYKTFLRIRGKTGQNVYPIPPEIESVCEMWTSVGGLLNSPFYMMDNSAFGSVGSITASFNNWDLVTYTTSMLYMAEINRAIGERFEAKVIYTEEGTKELHIFPSPHYGAGQSLIAVAYKRAPLGQVYGHPYFVKIAVGSLLMVWGGRVLGKHSHPLPGGGTINGQNLFDQGKQLYDEFTKKLIDEAAPPLGIIA